MNVLWTYHLIHDSTELADSIWENYVKKSNQIMFQKVRPDAFCKESRSSEGSELLLLFLSRYIGI
jgi:hypothetical protein